MAILSVTVTSKPYPIHTTQQVVSATSRSEVQITTMTKTLGKDDETKLDMCYPFPHSKKPEDKNTGPKFIVGNKKLKVFLDYCKANPI